MTSTRKLTDIADMLLGQLMKKFAEDGVVYPMAQPVTSTETLFTSRAVRESELYESIDKVLDCPAWARMRDYLSHRVRTEWNSQACVGKVVVYTEDTCPGAYIFEFRAIQNEDYRGKCGGLVYYRNERLAI